MFFVQVIKVVRQTLQDLLLAIEGTIIMSTSLKDMLDAMYDARVPEHWRKVCTARDGSWTKLKCECDPCFSVINDSETSRASNEKEMFLYVGR